MPKSYVLPYIENNTYNGIFTYLENVSTTGNILNDKLISVSGTSEDVGYEYSLGLGINNKNGAKYWRTIETDTDNTFIEIDFKPNKVTLSSILIYTGTCDFFPQYNIYGINGNTKTKITTFYHETYSYCVMSLLQIPLNLLKMFRKIKIEGAGKRGSNDYRFVIHRMEFYGIFHSSHDLINTCKISKKNKLCIFVMTIMSK